MHVLVVGHGVMGRNHVRVLYRRGHRVTTVDPRAPANHRDIVSALKAHRPDAAVVAVPVDHLVRRTLLLLERRIPTLVEKPVALSPDGARVVADRAMRWGTFVMADYPERYNPVYARLAARIAEQGGAELVHTVRVGPGRLDGDIRLDLLCHDVDLVMGLCPDARHIPTVAHHPHKLRTFTAHCRHGIVVADLIAHTVTSASSLRAGLPAEHCPGPEPLDLVWADFEARMRFGSPSLGLEREAEVLERALAFRGVGAAA